MSLAAELDQLAALHARGALTDQEFARAKARVLDAPVGRAGVDRSALAAVNGLCRSRADRWLGGVCGGLGRATGVASWIWRLVFVLSVLCAGTGLLVYLLMWLLLPDEPAWPYPPAASPRTGSA